MAELRKGDLVIICPPPGGLLSNAEIVERGYATIVHIQQLLLGRVGQQVRLVESNKYGNWFVDPDPFGYALPGPWLCDAEEFELRSRWKEPF